VLESEGVTVHQSAAT